MTNQFTRHDWKRIEHFGELSQKYCTVLTVPPAVQLKPEVIFSGPVPVPVPVPVRTVWAQAA